MKLVKKFLRLLPCFFIIACLIGCIVYNNNLNVSLEPFELFNIESELWSSIMLSFDYIIVDNFAFSNLHTWFSDNISNSNFMYLSFYILCYELILSLLFIMFDVINLIFGWCNKLIKKGSDFDV